MIRYTRHTTVTHHDAATALAVAFAEFVENPLDLYRQYIALPTRELLTAFRDILENRAPDVCVLIADNRVEPKADEGSDVMCMLCGEEFEFPDLQHMLDEHNDDAMWEFPEYNVQDVFVSLLELPSSTPKGKKSKAVVPYKALEQEPLCPKSSTQGVDEEAPYEYGDEYPGFLSRQYLS